MKLAPEVGLFLGGAWAKAEAPAPKSAPAENVLCWDIVPTGGTAGHYHVIKAKIGAVPPKWGQLTCLQPPSIFS